VPLRDEIDDDWDEDFDADDDYGDDDEEPTLPCPHCRAEIHEDAQRCPHCGEYISEEDTRPAARKPWWIILGVLAVMYLVYRWTLG
jgi:predicted nucleic acid-binding Zn ribbon protein